MNQETIPDNNLPVYLQEYSVSILNTDIPKCLIGGCQGTKYGCCCDTITAAIDASGSNCTGQCCGTQFGCCPYSTEQKIDPEGKNCGTIVGSVLYNTVGAIPSNVSFARVWQVSLSGYLKPNNGKYYIVYDFSKVNYRYKDKITFINELSGTFNICGKVLNASKYLDYKFCSAKLTLTVIIDPKKWDFRIKKEVLFSYRLTIDDPQTPVYTIFDGNGAIDTDNYKYKRSNSTRNPVLDLENNSDKEAIFNIYSGTTEDDYINTTVINFPGENRKYTFNNRSFEYDTSLPKYYSFCTSTCCDNIAYLGTEDVQTDNFKYTYFENISQLELYNIDQNHNNYFFYTDENVELVPVFTRRSTKCNDLLPNTFICDLNGENCFLQREFFLEFSDLCPSNNETVFDYFTWTFANNNYQLEISDVTTGWTLIGLSIKFQNYTNCISLSNFLLLNSSSYTIKIQKLSIQYSSTNTFETDTTIIISKGESVTISV